MDVCVYMYIYIYIRYVWMCVYMCIYIHSFIYTQTEAVPREMPPPLFLLHAH
jgi:hypothetical protein